MDSNYCERFVFGRARETKKKTNPFISLLLLVLVLLVVGGLAARADWPEFRGPWGDGRASAPNDTSLAGFPLYWSETNNVKWKTEIPYRGWSTPVVMAGQVWITMATE